MIDAEKPTTGLCRRDACKLSLGAIALSGALLTRAQPASAQTSSDIDALNLMVTVQYLLAQFLTPFVLNNGQVVQVPADRLNGDGIPGEPVRAGQAVSGIIADVRALAVEMANDDRNHLVPMRVVVGVPVARQPLIDVSAATGPFASIMQRAGVVGPTAPFSPYASENDFLYTLFYLKNVSVAAYRGLLPTLSNRVVMQNFAGLLAAQSIHLATVRSILFERGATVRQNTDRIAAFQNSLNGGGVFQGLSPQSRTTLLSASPIQVANIVPATSTGEVVGRNGPQILNQLFATSAAATSGGFFPEGIFGNIRTSASA